jgi:hypothetical protein
MAGGLQTKCPELEEKPHLTEETLTKQLSLKDRKKTGKTP